MAGVRVATLGEVVGGALLRRGDPFTVECLSSVRSASSIGFLEGPQAAGAVASNPREADADAI
jgi:hypothetical protein